MSEHAHFGKARREYNVHWVNLVTAAPQGPGIYSVWASGRLLYIGTAVNMRNRLMNHTIKLLFRQHECDDVRWIRTPGEECKYIPKEEGQDRANRLRMEHWLLQKHRPPLNLRVDSSCSPTPFLVPRKPTEKTQVIAASIPGVTTAAALEHETHYEIGGEYAQD